MSLFSRKPKEPKDNPYEVIPSENATKIQVVNRAILDIN